MSQETLRDSIVFLESCDPDATLPHSKAYATAALMSWDQLSSNAASLQSLGEGPINSKNFLAPGLSAKDLEKNKQMERKMKTARLIQFLKNYEPVIEEDAAGSIKNHPFGRGKDANKTRLSLSNLDHKTQTNLKNQDKGSPSKLFINLKDKEGTKPKKPKQVSLGTQFRRKSCHCSECGGISKLELKAQNIVKAPLKDLQTARNIRLKRKQKETDKQNMFLNLPNLNALVLSQKEKKEDANTKVRFFSQTPTKRNEYRSLTDAKFSTTLKNITTKDAGWNRRGSHTPLRRSRKDSLEGQVDQVVELPKQVFPSHYFIKIFTADDTEKQIIENRNEINRKEDDQKKSLIKGPVLAKKLPKPKRKRRESALYQEAPMSPSNLYFAQLMEHAEHAEHAERAEHDRSPRGFTTMISPNTHRPKIVVKKYVMKEKADDVPDEIVYNHNLETLDKETKKQMWGKIGLFSPKFKAIFGDKVEEKIVEEERKENEEEGNLTVEAKQEPNKVSRDFVKKIYSLPKQLPKLKILPGKVTMLTSRTDNSGPNSTRTTSHPVVNPLNMDTIHHTGPNYVDGLGSARTKTEPFQEWFSIYSSPKTARSYMKPALNFVPPQNMKESLPSITHNTNVFSPRGHRPTQSLGGQKVPIPIPNATNPRQKGFELKNVRGNREIKADLKKVVSNNTSNFSLNSTRLNQGQNSKR